MSLRPVQLRCEYLTDPLGIDARQPRLSWILQAGEPGQRQTAHQVVVRSGRRTVWDTGRRSWRESLHTVYGGPPLESGRLYAWRVRVWDGQGKASPWSPLACWSMGLLEPQDWHGQWIGLAPATRWQEDRSLPATLLRREFELAGPARRATLYASALGLYELRLNGQRVGDHHLAPEWTDYRRRVQYQTYDVTALLQPGPNAIAATLGAGWYAGRIGMAEPFAGVARGLYGRRLGLIAQLAVELEDGTTAEVVTDRTWRGTDGGPILAADLLDGETRDARREQPGWDRPGFEAAAWQEVATLPGPRLVAQPNEPVRITRTLPAVGLSEPEAGTWIFDLGQNMVGWPRLRLRAAPGAAVQLRYGEVLNPDGTLYRENLRGAPQVDHYVCRGGREAISGGQRPSAASPRCAGSGETQEVFEPCFTYHGFRYVEVTGLGYRPEAGDLTGCVLHSDAPAASSFECSEPLLNRIMEAIGWTLRGNLHGLPTDCPQRDERLGWMGDIQVFSQTAIFAMDLAAFFTKWLQDVRDAQTEDGRFPDFAPQPFDPEVRFSANPGWADAGVIVPWRCWVNYADRRLLEAQFDAAARWVDWVSEQNPDGIWRRRLGTGFTYGDWLNGDTFADLPGWPPKGGQVPHEVYATAFLAHSTELVSRMAHV
ncbi:MAG: family 78 glycoside hydrolase catalytic domain, partial [Candidatus Latescibacterota bacterium]